MHCGRRDFRLLGKALTPARASGSALHPRRKIFRAIDQPDVIAGLLRQKRNPALVHEGHFAEIDRYRLLAFPRLSDLPPQLSQSAAGDFAQQ